MIDVVLVCLAGMSTNVMRGKIEQAAQAADVPMSVRAIGFDDVDRYARDADIIVLGPQIRYAEESIREKAEKAKPGIPVIVMESVDFGMMRGDKVFQQIMKVINK